MFLKDLAKSFIFYLVACIGIFLMFRLVLSYTTFDSKVGFLAQKQDYINNKIWLSAFYIHVFSAAFCLLAGLTQFSGYLRIKIPKLHKKIGWMYCTNILLINFPIGFLMAIYANGFFSSKCAFILLDCLWFWFTLQAILAIKKRDFITHQDFMIRSYALTFSAITLRLWKSVFNHFFEIDPTTLYMIDAWLGFVPNLLVAEFHIRKTKKSKRIILAID